MVIWGDDSNFDVNVGDVLSASDDEGGQWTFEVTSLKPFGVKKLTGEDILDGLKPMIQGEMTFVDTFGNAQATLLDDFLGDESFVFLIVV